MRYSTLGPALETFGPSYKITGILLALGLLFSGVAFAVANEIHDHAAWIVFDGIALSFGVLLWRHLVCRAWLHEMGISYRKMLGYGEVRWIEVEQIYFETHEVDVHLIPLGSFSSLRLVTTHQKKIALGENIRNTEVLFEVIAKRTFDALYRNAVLEFNSGSEVDFGAIRVSREKGVTIRRWFRRQTIPWKDIAGFQFDAHFAQFDRMSRRLAAKVASKRVANTHALHALLTGVMRHVW